MYESLFEDKKFEVYKDNYQYIEEHNKLGKSYTLGQNQFMDLSFEEFSYLYLGSQLP